MEKGASRKEHSFNPETLTGIVYRLLRKDFVKNEPTLRMVHSMLASLHSALGSTGLASALVDAMNRSQRSLKDMPDDLDSSHGEAMSESSLFLKLKGLWALKTGTPRRPGSPSANATA